MSTWEEQRAEGYRSARMLRGVLRFVVGAGFWIGLLGALALASAWAGPS